MGFCPQPKRTIEQHVSIHNTGHPTRKQPHFAPRHSKITHTRQQPQPPTSGVRSTPSPLVPAPPSAPDSSLELVAASLDPGRGTGHVSMLYAPFVVLGNRCERVCENTTANHTASVCNSTYATRCNLQDTMQHYVLRMEHKGAQLMPHVLYSNQRTPNHSLQYLNT
jgi:hypothetical protein